MGSLGEIEVAACGWELLLKGAVWEVRRRERGVERSVQQCWETTSVWNGATGGSTETQGTALRMGRGEEGRER